MRGPIPRFRSHLFTALVGTVVAVAMWGVFLDGSRALPSLSHQYQAQAILPTSSALAANSKVTMAGVEVGYVESVTRDGADALVKFTLDSSHSPIPVDSRAALTLDTLIGEKSLAISPGLSNRMLPNGGILPMSQANDFVDVDQILSVLHGSTLAHARQAIEGLGGAVNGKGPQLNALLQGVAGTITTGAPVVHVLADDHAQVASLVSNLGQIAQQIGDRGAALQTLASDLTVSFRALAARDTAVRSVLDQLPATLAQVRATSGVLESTTSHAAPVIERLASAATDLSPTVHLLGPAADQGRAVLSELGGAAPKLQGTLTSLQHLSTPAVSTLPTLKAVLCQVNPLIRYVAPYAPELASMIENLGSAVNQYDANGHIARLNVGLGPNSVFGLLPPSIAQAETTLINSGLLSHVTMLGYNPYPAPGQANATTVGRGATGPQDAVNKYPRIQADC